MSVFLRMRRHRLLGWLLLASGIVSLAVLLWSRPSSGTHVAMANTVAPLEVAVEDMARVQRGHFTRLIRFSGTLMPVRQRLLNARMAGAVTDVRVREGEAVTAGQLLLRQDNSEWQSRLQQAEASVQASLSASHLADAQATQLHALRDRQFVASHEVDRSDHDVAMRKAQLEVDQTSVMMLRKTAADSIFSAPFAGVIAERLVEPGQMVVPNQALLRMVDLRELELQVQLPADMAASLRPGQKLSFRLENHVTTNRRADDKAAGMADNGAISFAEEKWFSAKILRVNPMIGLASRRISVYAQVHNADLLLRGGMQVSGVLDMGPYAEGLSVPETALQSSGVAAYGVMRIEKGRLRWQVVTPGERDEKNARIMVRGKLQEGDLVVTAPVSRSSDGRDVITLGSL